MLYVRTEVRQSLIQGLGLFATEYIVAGTTIAQYNHKFGWSCTEEDRLLFPQITQEFIWRYGWRYNGCWLIDIDDSRFINHCSIPNTIVTTYAGFTSYAARDITIGEELTEDYRQFDPDFYLYGADWKQ